MKVPMKTPARPHVTSILETCLHVKDVERSASFYENLFGFQRMASDARFCAFDVAPGCVFLLFRQGGTLEPVSIGGGVIPPHDGSGHLHVAFSIATQDLDVWRKHLKSNGIAIESEVHWEAGGHSLYFRDPDQHLIELATPGIWPNY
jgi:catechol 2,3-dioxygenase-like lactoylglutathione lyase family enzyme